ncbi:unnamed protein product [Arabis nemorensis]|uniref:Cysteine-rich transmembrane CYSTM domain-containing protein n=1 Tax=Arabis nemorensis TaxID=586526 RepID=A0A565CAB0_9BRAS|nr:unnamed protein product [Arabis nemorensis]
MNRNNAYSARGNHPPRMQPPHVGGKQQNYTAQGNYPQGMRRPPPVGAPPQNYPMSAPVDPEVAAISCIAVLTALCCCCLADNCC